MPAFFQKDRTVLTFNYWHPRQSLKKIRLPVPFIQVNIYHSSSAAVEFLTGVNFFISRMVNNWTFLCPYMGRDLCSFLSVNSSSIASMNARLHLHGSLLNVLSLPAESVFFPCTRIHGAQTNFELGAFL